MTRKTFENGATFAGLATALAGGLLLLLVGVDWLPQPWGLRGYLVIVVGSSSFYGFGCFHIWPNDDPKPGEHSWFWFAHQYWLNALGCATGWACVFLLLKKYVDDSGASAFSGGDILVAAVAFLGLIGHLPLMVTGFAVAIREIAKKMLEKLV